MKAAVFEQRGRPLVCEMVPDPEPGPGDLLLKVAYSGVCGTDLHLTQVGIDTALPAGMILGHEFCGEVVETGRSAGADWRRGDRVAVMPFRPCPACGAVCRNGLDIICPEVSYLGIARPGGNAEYVAVGAAQAIRLPEAVDDRSGALVEPLAVGLHAVRKVPSLLGRSVLIIGGGPVGLSVAIFARLAGASRVVVSEPHEVRRRRAEAVGATAVIDPGTEDVSEAFAAHAGGPPDIVFECVGTPGMIEEAVVRARLFGQVVVVGACMETDRLRPILALQKEISMVFSLGHDRTDFRSVVDGLERGDVRPAALVTGVVGFDAFPAAFEDLRSASAACKLLLQPGA